MSVRSLYKMSFNGLDTWESVIEIVSKLYHEQLTPYYDEECWLPVVLRLLSVVFQQDVLNYVRTMLFLEEPLWIQADKFLISVPSLSMLLNKPVRKRVIDDKFVKNFDIFQSANAVNVYEKTQRNRETDIVRRPYSDSQFVVVIMLIRCVIAVRHLHLHFRNSKCKSLDTLNRLTSNHENFYDIDFAVRSGDRQPVESSSSSYFQTITCDDSDDDDLTYTYSENELLEHETSRKRKLISCDILESLDTSFRIKTQAPQPNTTSIMRHTSKDVIEIDDDDDDDDNDGDTVGKRKKPRSSQQSNRNQIHHHRRRRNSRQNDDTNENDEDEEKEVNYDTDYDSEYDNLIDG
ncbi:gp60-like protein [Phenacoccus solenopsis nudivirus]|nr:gp60-like protein [Phenacoccus solenopsis nudivirus]